MSARSKSFLEGMRKKSKLAVVVIIVAMVIFTFRVLQINIKNGKEYSEAVVLQENYESSTIPYERGEILDRNGNVLANSEKTYSLIIEPNNIRLKPEYQTATRAALLKFFDISETVLDEKLAITGEYGYYQNILQDLKYDQVRDFENYCKTKDGDNVVGVYFETKYKRNYPNGTLACHLLGYTVAGNVGQYGIEGYYNDELNGVDGKSYSYMSGNDGIASETVPAENGETVVSTIDMNIQKIIEDNISEYMQNTGAKQIGIIAMDPNNGEVLGMASSLWLTMTSPPRRAILRLLQAPRAQLRLLQTAPALLTVRSSSLPLPRTLAAKRLPLICMWCSAPVTPLLHSARVLFPTRILVQKRRMKWTEIRQRTAARTPFIFASASALPRLVFPTKRQARQATLPRMQNLPTVQTGCLFTPARHRRQTVPTSTTKPSPLRGSTPGANIKGRCSQWIFTMMLFIGCHSLATPCLRAILPMPQ